VDLGDLITLPGKQEAEPDQPPTVDVADEKGMNRVPSPAPYAVLPAADDADPAPSAYTNLPEVERLPEADVQMLPRERAEALALKEILDQMKRAGVQLGRLCLL